MARTHTVITRQTDESFRNVFHFWWISESQTKSLFAVWLSIFADILRFNLAVLIGAVAHVRNIWHIHVSDLRSYTFKSNKWLYLHRIASRVRTTWCEILCPAAIKCKTQRSTCALNILTSFVWSGTWTHWHGWDAVIVICSRWNEFGRFWSCFLFLFQINEF